MTTFTCEVCGRDTSPREGMCTNGRCQECHHRHCTAGGDTSPGHGRGTVKTLAQRALIECPKCKGTGQTVHANEVPFGSTTAVEWLADPCDALPAGICHGCGDAIEEESTYYDETLCKACRERMLTV